jgi:hypothetical protein
MPPDPGRGRVRGLGLTTHLPPGRKDYMGFSGAVMWNAAPYSLKSRRPPTEPAASKRSGYAVPTFATWSFESSG